jgi:hypothetical protein
VVKVRFIRAVVEQTGARWSFEGHRFPALP